jgi:hypothetical protein
VTVSALTPLLLLAFAAVPQARGRTATAAVAPALCAHTLLPTVS